MNLDIENFSQYNEKRWDASFVNIGCHLCFCCNISFFEYPLPFSPDGGVAAIFGLSILGKRATPSSHSCFCWQQFWQICLQSYHSLCEPIANKINHSNCLGTISITSSFVYVASSMSHVLRILLTVFEALSCIYNIDHVGISKEQSYSIVTFVRCPIVLILIKWWRAFWELK